MKRRLSLFLVLCLLVSLCGTIVVNAEPNAAITGINITGVTLPVMGQECTVEGITCDIPGVTMEAMWFGYYAKYGGMMSVDSFDKANLYGVEVTLVSEEPIFYEGITATANGALRVKVKFDNATRVFVMAYYPLDVTPSTHLDITGTYPVGAGAPITKPDLQAENAYVSAFWTRDGDFMNVGTVFEEGVKYTLEVGLFANQDYYFAEDMVITVDGQPYDVLGHLSITDASVTLIYHPQSRSNGDLTGDNAVNNKDVEYLLWHTLFPDTYPVSASVDFDGDGKVNNKDVEYLLWHTLFPGSYPLN